MPDYSKGVIYMIEPTVEYEEGDVYYGSTTQPLYKRFHTHKTVRNQTQKNTSSKHLFQKYGNNIKIVLVKAFPCNSIQELCAEEGKYIRENKCVNKYIAGRSQAEYIQEHKEERNAYSKAYHQEHKEEIKKRTTAYYQEHKEEKKAYSKARYQDRKEELKQKIKCECGCMVKKNALTLHKRSNKHTKLLADNITVQESV
jgi:hypothetical protein